jgi:hypothetical protein
VCITNDYVCHAQCTTGSQCNSGCCAQVTGESYGVCASTDHCQPTGYGVGTHCTANTQCASGTCAGGTGWCTESCSPSNTICAGGYGTAGLYNSYGQLNWCIRNNAGADSCFPGCSSNADCVHFPGTTCKSGYDVSGKAISVCSA